MGILIALPIAAAIAIFDRRKIEEFIFLAIGIIISIIIVAGYMGNTLPGVYVGVGLGICSMVCCVWFFFKDRERFIDSVVTPGLWGGMLCFFLLGLVLWNDAGVVGKTGSDMYRVYAPQILNMYRYNSLGAGSPGVGNYNIFYSAPVWGAWCYFCNKLWFDYSDAVNLWSKAVFVVSALLPLYTFIKKRELVKNVLLALVVMMIPNIVADMYDLSNDVTLGAAAVYGTVMSLKLYRDREKYNDIGYIAACMCGVIATCAMKRAGAFFLYGAIGTAASYTMRRICTKDENSVLLKKIIPLFFLFLAVLLSLSYPLYKASSLYDNIWEVFDESLIKGMGREFIIPIACCFLFVLVGIFSWWISVRIEKKSFIIAGLAIALSYLLGLMATFFLTINSDFFSVNNSEADAKGKFFDYFSIWFNATDDFGSRFSQGWIVSDAFFIMMLFVIAGAARVYLERKKLVSVSGLYDYDSNVILAFVGNQVIVYFWCLYLSSYFSVEKGFNSMSRYLGPGLLILVVVVLYELFCITSINNYYILIAALSILIVLLPVNLFKVHFQKSGEGWSAYNKMYEEAGIELTEDDYVLCIAPDSSIYYVFPAKSYQDEAAAGCDITPEDWTAQIISAGYNYLVLEDYKYTFPETYQDMFEGGACSVKKYAMYDIVVDGDRVKFVLRKKDV